MVSGIQGMSSISSDMIAQMKEKMFARLDSDGDGQINLATLADEMEADGGSVTSGVSGGSEPFAAMYEALTAADVNGDGVVSQDEFNAMEPPAPPQGDFSGVYSADATESSQYDLIGMLLDQLG